MIDHITFGVSDYARSTAFYDAAFAPLGVTRLFDVPPEHTGGAPCTGYGDLRPWFWIIEQDATRGKLHVALEAGTRAQVDAFHAAALAAGGRDNGAPGLRPHFDPDYYGAFVFDPDGHNIEAVCRRRESPPADLEGLFRGLDRGEAEDLVVEVASGVPAATRR